MAVGAWACRSGSPGSREMWPGWVWVGELQAVSWRHLVVMTGIAAPALKGMQARPLWPLGR